MSNHRFTEKKLVALAALLSLGLLVSPASAEPSVFGPQLAQAQEEKGLDTVLTELDVLANAEPPGELTEEELQEWAAQSELIRGAQFGLGEAFAGAKTNESAVLAEDEVPAEVTELTEFTVVSPAAQKRQEQAIELIGFRVRGLGASF